MRLTVIMKDDKYASIEIEEFHEDGEFLKAYTKHNELAGVFKLIEIKAAYISERRGNESI